MAAACATPRAAFPPDALRPGPPRFENGFFVSDDGAALALNVWEAEGGQKPPIVVIGLHGMNDYANAFRYLGPDLAKAGITTYAFDQRGFGRNPDAGRWLGADRMRQDLLTAIAVARKQHPDAAIAVAGISMGGAVAMSALARPDAPDVDRLVLLAPAVRGWSALPLSYRASLAAARFLGEERKLKPPKFVTRKIWASDNVKMLQENWKDPFHLKETKVEALYGLVGLMENGFDAAASLPQRTLVLYGARDQIIPPAAMARASARLPDHVRTLYYPKGYHMLTRDLNGAVVRADIAAFLKSADFDPPSGAGPLPEPETLAKSYWRGEDP